VCVQECPTGCLEKVPELDFDEEGDVTRMETAFTGYGQWYIDSRGWGDLVMGTPLEWPVPYQELFARGSPSYRNDRVAARSNYGW
jgi:hypothetical protein